MKISRKLFINSRNKQASITLPKKVLEELQQESNKEKMPKKIFLEILIPNGRKTMDKKDLYKLIMIGVVTGLFVFFLYSSLNNPIDYDYNLVKCPNFNSKDFLLSGGSSNPQTIYDVEYEFQRLNWLCHGGNN